MSLRLRLNAASPRFSHNLVMVRKGLGRRLQGKNFKKNQRNCFLYSLKRDKTSTNPWIRSLESMLRQYQTSFGCYQIRPEKIDKNNIEFLSGPWTLVSFSGPITERNKGKPKKTRVTATLNLRLFQTTGITVKCQYRNDFMSSVFNFHGNFRWRRELLKARGRSSLK